MIYGFHSVQSRLRQGAAGVEALYVDASRDDRRTQALVETAKGMGLMVHPVDAKRLEGLTGNARHQGVVAIVAPPAARELDDILDALAEPALLLILDGVTDPHNLGACLRVADAAVFGVQDEEFGQRLKAFVVPPVRPLGIAHSRIDEEVLLAVGDAPGCRGGIHLGADAPPQGAVRALVQGDGAGV